MSDAVWIETYSGKEFHFLNPQPEQICIEDIAHALSNQCRYTGHTKRFMSVAEHSYLVSLMCPTVPLIGLLHDASEAYLSDLSRPVKHGTAIGPPYLELEDRVMQAIFGKFGLSLPLPPEVKAADNKCLWLEKKKLMPGLEWSKESIALCGVTPEDESVFQHAVVGYNPHIAEKLFLDRFYDLTSDRQLGNGQATIAGTSL